MNYFPIDPYHYLFEPGQIPPNSFCSTIPFPNYSVREKSKSVQKLPVHNKK